MADSIHAQWLGMLQPQGLVVSIPVLQDLELWTRQDPAVQQGLRAACPDDALPDLATLIAHLGWPAARVDTSPECIQARSTHLSELGATLRPSGLLSTGQDAPYILLSWCAHDLDEAPPADTWPASAQERFERLLLAQGTPIGLHVNSTTIRLTYAPSGQAPGRLSFPLQALLAADGRILVDALHMLLGVGRLFVAAQDKQLPAILAASRTRQEAVTVALADQVEDALRILLAGFDAADARADGQLMQGLDRAELYEGLTTLLLRLVFVLYAEDRGLLPMHEELYQAHYSVTGLAEQLRSDAVRYHSAMDRRFGAYSRLLTLFRLVHSGGHHHSLRLPPRRGKLFDPMSWPFLEGRRSQSQDEAPRVPRVDDGVMHQVLTRLLHLEGQRISYRNLEVEQIGSVYENIMGFEIRRTTGPTAVGLNPLSWTQPNVRSRMCHATQELPARISPTTRRSRLVWGVR